MEVVGGGGGGTLEELPLTAKVKKKRGLCGLKGLGSFRCHQSLFVSCKTLYDAPIGCT